MMIALVLSLISSFLLYTLVNATTTMWCLFWVNLALLTIGTILNLVSE
jgi:hypothetical protein